MKAFRETPGESRLGGYKASYSPDVTDHLHFPHPCPAHSKSICWAIRLQSLHYAKKMVLFAAGGADPNQEKPRVLPAHPHLLINPGL